MAKRTHVPALKGRKLRTAVRAVGKLPINKYAKKALQDMLVEATVPDRGDPDRLPPERAANIRRTESLIKANTTIVLARAAAELHRISDEDWKRLVDEANEDSET